MTENTEAECVLQLVINGRWKDLEKIHSGIRDVQTFIESTYLGFVSIRLVRWRFKL